MAVATCGGSRFLPPISALGLAVLSLAGLGVAPTEGRAFVTNISQTAEVRLDVLGQQPQTLSDNGYEPRDTLPSSLIGAEVLQHNFLDQARATTSVAPYVATISEHSSFGALVAVNSYASIDPGDEISSTATYEYSFELTRQATFVVAHYRSSSLEMALELVGPTTPDLSNLGQQGHASGRLLVGEYSLRATATAQPDPDFYLEPGYDPGTRASESAWQVFLFSIIAPVPEPASGALLLGAIMFGAGLRRRGLTAASAAL
ncbi:hypothetical protein Mal64_34380 [Pseudobythopirellula maris]|uniref:PEP-CTERM protein-sorting domain-containing protein n=1 Tax=Pseudobythopirellula maris TaxID=2527991 RepID=A0A5C5ZII2_9BACT|nr:PEP-CTERM sorting domain-containing protein [Pseudobythopirellula maris]TWT86611.1 hypothetical protein Mal64_34380 [Pseudobythopirellula maris]